MSTNAISTSSHRKYSWLIALTTVLGAPLAFAATDLADYPLATASTLQAKPNILYILDDSGSMGDDAMPDGVNSGSVGQRNSQCNTIYYNPATNYVIPKDHAGTYLNNATQTTFTSAYTDGYYNYYDPVPTPTKKNLSSAYRAGNDGSDRAAYYWTYVGSGTLIPKQSPCTFSITSSTTTGICDDGTEVTNSPASCTAPRTLVWKKILVSSTSGPGGTDERQNFANWYSYYRLRLMMMKAASARSMETVGSGYRLGFMTIHPGTSSSTAVDSAKFLKVADFDATHRQNWYSILYSQTANGYTPLRTALSTAGRYFAGKNDGINNGMVPTAADDPVQYSCQQNFAILTTDGYWNTTGGYTLDGTTSIGNTDGNILELDAYNTPASKKFSMGPRPIYDGSLLLVTTQQKDNFYRYTTCTKTQAQQRTIQYQKRTTQIQKRTIQYQTRTQQIQQRTQQLQMRTVQYQKQITQLQTRTSSNSGSTWTAWTNVSSCTPDNSGSSRRQCQTITTMAWTNVGSCTAGSSGGATTSCQTTSDSGWVNTGTCGASSADPGPTITCQTTDTGWVNASSCSASSSGGQTISCQTTDTGFVNSGTCTPSSSGGRTVTCQTTSDTGWVNASSCTASAATASPTITCQTTDTGWVNVGSCSASSSGGQVITCQTASDSGWGNVASCTPSAPASGPTVTCQNTSLSGNKIQVQVITTTTDTTYNGTTVVSSTPSTSSGSWADTTGTCYATGSVPVSTLPALPSPNPQPATTGFPGSCTAWPCETGQSTTGTSNTLADVAQYYYKTDLRPAGSTGALGTDVSDNNVASGGSGIEDDRANWQHMTTFTMGLGLSGNLPFDPNYKSASTGTFQQLRGVQTPVLDWPSPSADSPTAIDDLWHAAVNGRGRYFSAASPDTVIQGLNQALSAIKAITGSAAAAATSTQEPVSGKNFVYLAKYKTQEWTGEVEAHQINLTTGQIESDIQWSAQAKLDLKVSSSCDNRAIKLFRSGATNNLVDFKWNTDTCDTAGNPLGSPLTTLNATEQAYFDSTKASLLSQYPSMTDGSSASADQKTAAGGANLLNYIRGQSGKEGFISNDINKLYRSRVHKLGDVVNAQPLYLDVPSYSYDDAGYADFITSNAARIPVVLVGANDGMLHAFYAGQATPASTDGTEAWAFVPRSVLPNLYKLADETYASNHQFYVDGTPVYGDVYDSTSSTWKSIVVGGLNKGGKGYYALDITNPLTPKALWEFTDTDLGYTYGNPIIAKQADGTWVVFVTSGYNNSDGHGYFYVLNAMTGAIIKKLSTGTSVGNTTTPAGLGKITYWADNPAHNNTALRVYGTDLLGNIWRFAYDSTLPTPDWTATLLATLSDSDGNPQPITARPRVAKVGNDAYIYVGTGRYLGSSDVGDTQTQSFYAIKDNLSSTTLTDLRSTLRQMTITNVGSGSATTRTIACTAQCDSTAGWFADFPDEGERINVDFKIVQGNAIVPSNVPKNNACNVGGYHYINMFEYSQGTTPVGLSAMGTFGGDSLAVGLTTFFLSDGRGFGIVVPSDGSPPRAIELPPGVAGPSGTRVSWREIQ